MNVLIFVLLLVGVAVPTSAGALRSGTGHTAAELEIMRLAGSFSSKSKTTASVDTDRRIFVDESEMVMSMSMSTSGSVEIDPSPEPTMAPTFAYLETLKIEAKTALTGIDCATFLADSESMDAFVNVTKYGMFTNYGDQTTIAALAATTVTIDSDECEDEGADRRLTSTSRRLTASADVAWEAVIEDVQELGYADADTLFTQVDNAYSDSIDSGAFLTSFQAQASDDVATAVTGVVAEEIDYEVETEYAVEDDDEDEDEADDEKVPVGAIVGGVLGGLVVVGVGAYYFMADHTQIGDEGDGVGLINFANSNK